jgi:hypothetical protein
MQSKFHNISIKRESFEDLQRVRANLPFKNLSLSQTVDWLIDVGLKQIRSELQNDNTIHKR